MLVNKAHAFFELTFTHDSLIDEINSFSHAIAVSKSEADKIVLSRYLALLTDIHTNFHEVA